MLTGINVEDDVDFDSRPPSRGFDSRPPSRGDLLPGSRPLSGIIKPSSLHTDLSGLGDSLVGDKKKRLKSAGRVTFPEAHRALQEKTAESETTGGNKTALALGMANGSEEAGMTLPHVNMDTLNVPSTEASRRLGALFLGSRAFRIDDFIRAKDAGLGVVAMYNAAAMDSRHSSKQGTPSSSQAGSRLGTPSSGRSANGQVSRPGSSTNALRGSAHSKRDAASDAYRTAKILQNEKLQREKAMREEQQRLLYETKFKIKHDAGSTIKAWCRSHLWRACITRKDLQEDDPDLFLFLHKRFSMLIALRIHCFLVRRKYASDPYMNDAFKNYFHGCPRSTLLANWECNVAVLKIAQRQFFDAHVALKHALEDLQRHGMMTDMNTLDLPTFHFVGGKEEADGSRENPFCAFPGCSRRPVKVCEWDNTSKICDLHQYPSYWDRDSNSTSFHDKHPMSIAYPNRREMMWMNVLMTLHPRLGAGYEKKKHPDDENGVFLKCHFAELVLPKTVQGADKYGGNTLHLVEKVLIQAWTITIPDDCNTLQKALDMAKDDFTVFFRTGYYAWKTPVEVRKRIKVTGESGVILHGPWAMDENVGGGEFEGVTCVTACGQGLHLRGGRWIFRRCTLRGYGEGATVLSCGGSTELFVEKTRVCGLQVDTGLWRPFVGIVAGGDSHVTVVGSSLQDASGYGILVSNRAYCKIDKSEIVHNYKAGVMLQQDADVLIVNSVIRDNTACFEAKGTNMPLPVQKVDPDPEKMPEQENDCLQIYGNRMHGILWATRQKPKLLLGRCQYKNSAYKGDILKDNFINFQDNTAPSQPLSGTGHEAFVMAWPDNSALRVTDGSFLMENYMFLRTKYNIDRPDGKTPYVLEANPSWAETAAERKEYGGVLHRPGTSGSIHSHGGVSSGILSRPGTAKTLRQKQNVMFLAD